MKAGIIGGAGYTAGELIRLLIHHPKVELAFSQSGSQSGRKVTDIHGDLLGDTDMTFTDEITAEADIYFLCAGHGKSSEVLQKYPFLADKMIIDLSHDHRLERDPGRFVYGLPELYREDIASAKRVANPGCLATCIQLGLLPLARGGALSGEVHIHAITGSTGAGAGLSATSHFSWRHANLSVYKPFEHQHLAEIELSLQEAAGDPHRTLHFVPVRGPFTRGIMASMYIPFSGSAAEVDEWFRESYREEPFVLVSERNPELKQVVNTNKCIVHAEVVAGRLLVVSMIDNLLKGASGQAVQNMNIMMGWEESTGLKLKSTAF